MDGQEQIVTGRRPRVAVVTHGFLPLIGGAEMHHFLGARILLDQCTVEIFTADLVLEEAKKTTPINSDGTPTSSLPFRVHYLPSVRIQGERLVLPTSLWGALGRFSPDVIWTNSPSLTADLAALYAVSHAIRWVATYHADFNLNSWSRRWLMLVEARLLRHAAMVEVSSRYYARKLKDRGVRSDRLTVILPYSVWTVARGQTVSAEPRPVSFMPGPDHPFLFVGVLDRGHAYKRPELALNQLARVRCEGVDAYLDVVGDGERRAELELLSGTLRFGGAVRFLGRVSDERLSKSYQNAWAFVMASDSDLEGFGLAALEALRFGCPVIASSASPIAETLIEAGSGLIWEKANPDSLGDALKRLWGDPSLRRSLSLAASKFFESISWESIRDRTVSFVVGPHLPRGRRPSESSQAPPRHQ